MYRFLKIIIILFCFSLPSLATEIDTLSLEQAFEIAKTKNPKLKARVTLLEINEGEIKAAKAWQNPSIISDSGTAEDTYRAGIGYTFELGGKRRKRTEVAKSQLETNRNIIDTEWLDFRGEIRQAFTKLYFSQERLKILEQILKNSEQLLGVSQKREELGDIPVMSVLQAEITKLNTENEIEKARHQKLEAQHHLEFLLSTKLSEAIELALPKTLNLDELIELKDTAMNNRPELKTNNEEQKLAENKLKLAKANRIPDLNVSAGPDFVTGSDGGVGAFFMAQMKLPVFNLQGGEIDAIEARQKQLSLEREAIKNKIETEVEHAYLLYDFYELSLKRYEENLLPKVKDLADKALKSFELGKSTVIVPVDAQIAYMNTRLDYIQTLMSYQESITMLERAVGAGL